MKISNYYKEKDYNVLQTAIENLNQKYEHKLINDTQKNGFIVNMNLCSDLIEEMKKMGYRIRKIKKIK